MKKHEKRILGDSLIGYASIYIRGVLRKIFLGGGNLFYMIKHTAAPNISKHLLLMPITDNIFLFIFLLQQIQPTVSLGL